MVPVFSSRKRRVDDGPDEDIETEGERHLQTLAKKQLKTNISLDQQFSQHREFSGTSAFKPSVESLSGIVNLSEYQQLSETDARVEELGHFGLTKEEMKLRLKYDTSVKDTETMVSRFSVNPQVEKERLDAINRKIHQKTSAFKTSDNFADIRHVTRHEIDLERAISSTNQDGQKISNFLIKQKEYEKSNPLSMVPDLMTEIDSKIKDQIREKRKKQKLLRKKSKVDKSHGSQTLDSDQKSSICVHQYNSEKESPNILCDEEISSESGDDVFIGPLPKPVPEQTGRKEIRDNVKPIPEQCIISNRLSVDNIIQIPKFENYTPGEINNVLYLKNLHSNVTQQDLIALFGRFEQKDEPSIVYKLMSGRMRGQAFITFSDKTISKEALELVNGYHLYGKPIIIQYGNKQ
ncbi:RNA-binding protein 41 isoform X2 [Patella vulgata]|nr:RNA-binding protein 41 isoform X2 [Patella vulgata]